MLGFTPSIDTANVTAFRLITRSCVSDDFDSEAIYNTLENAVQAAEDTMDASNYPVMACIYPMGFEPEFGMLVTCFDAVAFINIDGTWREDELAGDD